MSTSLFSGVTLTSLSVRRSCKRVDGQTPIDYIVSMTERKIYDKEGHAHYVTLICYKRRRLLDDSMASRIVIGVLNDQLKKQKGACSGFVIMPDHVHAIVWFTESNQISHFMKQWKHRTSYQIKQSLSKYLNNIGQKFHKPTRFGNLNIMISIFIPVQNYRKKWIICITIQ